MADLRLHGRPVHAVFDLLADKEDDITYSFGWALANSDRLASKLLTVAFQPPEVAELGELTALRLQETVPGAGRTDVEVETERAHLILEAKRGWNLPTTEQLAQYAGRFSDGRAPRLLVVAECSSAWATARLPTAVGGVPVVYVSWEEVAAMVEAVAAAARTAEKRLLREFVRYLKGLMTMQDPTSNMVFVVSLGLDDLFGSGVSFADIVVKHNRYFHPVGGGRGGWPKTPPNYVGSASTANSSRYATSRATTSWRSPGPPSLTSPVSPTGAPGNPTSSTSLGRPSCRARPSRLASCGRPDACGRRSTCC